MGMKRESADTALSVSQGAVDEVLRGWLPSVHEWLTELSWEDGKTRRASTLLLMTENGRWKAFFHDRDAKRGFWVTGSAYEDLMETLEKTLSSGSAEWRKDQR